MQIFIYLFILKQLQCEGLCKIALVITRHSKTY